MYNRYNVTFEIESRYIKNIQKAFVTSSCERAELHIYPTSVWSWSRSWLYFTRLLLGVISSGPELVTCHVVTLFPCHAVMTPLVSRHKDAGPRHIILKSAQNWNVSSDTERSEDFEDPVNIFTQCIIDTVMHSWHHDSRLFIDVFILLKITFLSLRKHKANTTELHPKVRQTCYLFERYLQFTSKKS